MRSGRSRPACSARSQPVLRATPDSTPSRKAPAVARTSARPNTGPIRSLSAASSRSQATSDPDQTATDIDAAPLPHLPRREPYRRHRCNCSTNAVPDKRNIMGEFVPMLDTAIKKGYVRKIGDGLFEITPEFEALIDERHAASRYSERRPDPAPNR